MTAIELRTEIKQIIDRTNDTSLLEWLKTFLLNPAENMSAMEDMTRMAELSDADIAAGRVHTIDEVKAWMKEQKGKA